MHYTERKKTKSHTLYRDHLLRHYSHVISFARTRYHYNTEWSWHWNRRQFFPLRLFRAIFHIWLRAHSLSVFPKTYISRDISHLWSHDTCCMSLISFALLHSFMSSFSHTLLSLTFMSILSRNKSVADVMIIVSCHSFHSRCFILFSFRLLSVLSCHFFHEIKV